MPKNQDTTSVKINKIGASMDRDKLKAFPDRRSTKTTSSKLDDRYEKKVLNRGGGG